MLFLAAIISITLTLYLLHSIRKPLFRFRKDMITILIISLSLMVVTLFVSHKIAGHLSRLEQDINVIAKGDLTFTARLRKGDQLRELSADINEMTASLNTKVAAIQSGVERVMISASDQNAPKWFQEKLRQLHERIGRNFKILSDG